MLAALSKLTPTWYRVRMLAILRRIDTTLRAWLSVTAVSMLVVAILTGLGLAMLDIREWLALGRSSRYVIVHPELRSRCRCRTRCGCSLRTGARKTCSGRSSLSTGVSFVQSQVVKPDSGEGTR